MASPGDLDALLDLQSRMNALREREALQTTLSGRRACAEDRAALLLERRKAISALQVPFWATVLAAHPGIGSCITIDDCCHLTALKHVDSTVLPNKTDGLRIIFEFAENPAFGACVVAKTCSSEDVAGSTVGRGRIPWRDVSAKKGGAFFRWLEDAQDLRDLRFVLHRDVIPRAIELYLGIGQSSSDEADEVEFAPDGGDDP
jgi:hypothetical protein